MKQKRTFVTLLLVIALLCLGIAYAIIQGTELVISGEASTLAADGNIDVQFTNYDIQEDVSAGKVAATVGTDGLTANINVSELKTAGQSATVVYTIENKAEDMAATLTTPDITWTNTKWFDVECTLGGTSLEKYSADGDTDSTTATVVVTLKETVVTDKDAEAAVADDISITINANPVENATTGN